MTPASVAPTRRTALVTGASRGIGAAVAGALAAMGVRVALVARGEAGLRSVAATLAGDPVVVPCDVTDEAQVQRMAAEVTRAFGAPPDILVNNAGVFQIAPLATMSSTLFVETVQSNLIAPFFVLRAFLPAMRERGHGDIVTIGSIADRMVLPENGAYSPSKYGLRALHEVLRGETRGTGVRATLVSPGAVDTTIWDPVRAEDHTRRLPPRDVMLSPDAVAAAVAFVVSQPAAVTVDELRLSHS